MLVSKYKKALFLMIALVGIWPYGHAEAFNFQMELVASIPNPSNPQETLASKVIIGIEDRATDGFDTAWDVVAIPGGIIQAYFDHSEYSQEVRFLWRDTRPSTGFPKVWDVRVRPSQSGSTVTLHWAAADLSSLPSNFQIRLIDITNGNQELDMRSASSYSYLHPDHTQDHFFQITLDEIVASEPPPQVQPPEIATNLLPEGILRKKYWALLEGKGGTLPYRWQIVSGGLPQGLTLDSREGIISGKPRRLGQYHLRIQLTDEDGVIRQKDFTLSIVLKQQHPNQRK